MKKYALMLAAALFTTGLVFAAGTAEQPKDSGREPDRAPALGQYDDDDSGAYVMGPGFMRGGPVGGYRLWDSPELKKNPVSAEGTVSTKDGAVILTAKDKSFVLIVPGFGVRLGTLVKDGTTVKVDGYAFRPASIDYRADLDRIVVTAATVDGKTYDLLDMAWCYRSGIRRGMMRGVGPGRW